MVANSNHAQVIRALTDDERRFVLAFVEHGNAEHAKEVSGYRTSVAGAGLLQQAHIGAAVRWEVARRLAVEGGQVGFKTLKRIAQDTKAPAAAQVAAATRLLQGAGLLEPQEKGKESKSINDMTREELRGYIESKKSEIDSMERALADRATDITPKTIQDPTPNDYQTIDPFD